MFDFSFSELIAIGLVALIVIGPQRLPKVARTAGHFLGRLQRYVSDVKSDIQREMQLEDLKKIQQDVERQARDLENSMRVQVASVEADLGKTVGEVKSSLSAAPEVAVPVVESPVPADASAKTSPAALESVSVADSVTPQLALSLDDAQLPVRKPVEKT